MKASQQEAAAAAAAAAKAKAHQTPAPGGDNPTACPSRSYYFPLPPPMHELPFVADRVKPDGGRFYWTIKRRWLKGRDFDSKHRLGGELACHFMEYLKGRLRIDNSGGVLNSIVSSMDTSNLEDEAVRIGFFHFLESCLADVAKSIDAYDVLDRNQRAGEAAMARGMARQAAEKAEATQ